MTQTKPIPLLFMEFDFSLHLYLNKILDHL